MHRIDVPSASPTLPAPAAAGSPGYWTSGDPVAGTAPTILDQDFFNAVQEELYGIVLAAGITPAKANRAQVLQAIGVLTAGTYADKTTAGTDTLTVPTWARHAEVQMLGAGGGGGGSAAGFSGGGGGAGGYSFGIVSVTPGAVLTRTIGAGGTGAGGGGTASAGGSTSLTGFGSASGGGGGTGGTTTSAGGAGGTANNAGVRNFTGGTGGDGNSSNQAVQGGNGAAGPFGGEGRTGAGAGVKGQAAGAGGGGAWNSNGAGGAGADGAVLIRWLP